MKYSIIVPFHSNLNLLAMCLSSLSSTLDFSTSEIIIVDNNAAGSQIDQALVQGKQYKIIQRTENLMYPRAINLGASCAQGEYLIFCDADAFVSGNFHIALTCALEREDVGYAAAKLLNAQTNNIQEFGITSSYYNYPHPFAGRRQDFELVAHDHYPLAACAACSAIQKNLFFTMGGFDEELVHSYSDIDLCLRLADRGYRTACVADAKAYHCGASTVGSGMSTSMKEDTKGVFASKHPQVPIQIQQYLNIACRYFLSNHRLRTRDYFFLDCSTIANPELYINTVSEALNLNETMRHQRPYSYRDAQHINFINFIPYTIRNYRVPILYFVDSFLAFSGNGLWKSCRIGFEDIVLDRHANIELLQCI